MIMRRRLLPHEEVTHLEVLHILPVFRCHNFSMTLNAHHLWELLKPQMLISTRSSVKLIQYLKWQVWPSPRPIAIYKLNTLMNQSNIMTRKITVACKFKTTIGCLNLLMEITLKSKKKLKLDNLKIRSVAVHKF